MARVNEMRERGLGAKAACEELRIHSSTYFTANRHVQAVERYGIDPALPRRDVALLQKQIAEGPQLSEAEIQAEKVILQMQRASSSLTKIDPIRLAGYLNEPDATRRRSSIKRSARELMEWLSQLHGNTR